MKTLLLFPALFALFFASAQNSLNYHLEVKNNQGTMVAQIPVVFIETKTFERLAFKTGNDGKLDVLFDRGENWIGSVGEMTNCLEVKIPRSGKMSKTLTYNLAAWERENRLLPDRRSFVFEQVPQSVKTVLPPTERESFLTVKLQNNEGTVFADVPVTLTCFALSQQFTAKTNIRGEAYFYLPVSNDYEIDIEDVPSISWMDFDRVPKTASVRLLYEKKRFTEKVVGRYVEQALPADVVASSTHAKVKLQVKQSGELLQDESVYIRMLRTGKVYKAKTNSNGEALFMLPIRGKYMVDFTYQKDAAVVDLSKVKGLAEQSQIVAYVPDPRLQNIESFMPKVKDLVEYDIDNFVSKQYPSGSNPVELFLKWGNKFNASSKEALLEIGFRVNGSKSKTLMPKNLVFVVDISGSMAGEDRLELLKKNLAEFVERCTPQDQIGLVVFDSEATLAFKPQKMTNKQELIDIIRALQPRGGTNIYNGLILGLDELMKTKNSAMVNRIVLMTDGYCSVEPMVTIAKAKEYVNRGVQISAIGIGVDYNQALLSQLATVGGGLMQMAGNPSQFQPVFLKEFYSMVEPLGKDVKLEVLYNDQIVYRQIMGYHNEVVSKGSMVVTMDQIFPGLQKMALMKFDLIHPTEAIEQLPVTVRLTYYDLEKKQNQTVEKKIHPDWTQATGEMDITLDKEHKKALVVAIANQSLKNMCNHFEAGDRPAAEQSARDAVKQIKELFPDAEPAELETLINKLEEYVAVLEMSRLNGK
jgi:hypothetical protein